jgi:hypothetical protein
MSIAMSATLFATNSITIFAEEGIAFLAEEEPAVEEVGGDPASWAPVDLPTPETTSETKIEDYGDYVVVTTTNTTDLYASDMNSEDSEGNQADYYLPVNAEDTNGQTLDFSDSYKDENVVDYSVVLRDSDGDIVTVPTEDGKEVPLELPRNFDIEEDLEEVFFVENSEGETEEVSPNEKIYYGYIGEDGVFVESEDGEPYVLTGENDYAVAGKAYSTIVNGERVILDEEVYKALKGDESSIYYATTVKNYDYKEKDGTTSQNTKDEILEKKDVISVDDDAWKYTVKEDGNPELAWLYESVVYDSAVVIGHNHWGEAVANFYFTGKDGQRYFNQKVVYGNYAKGDSVTIGYWNKNDHVDFSDWTYLVTEKEVKMETVYIRVYDKEGNLLFQCDKTAFDNLTDGNITKVTDEKYAVIDENRERVLIDVDVYTDVFMEEKEVDITNIYYYTVQDKYEKEPVAVAVNLNDQEYELTVAFWQNSRIGAESVEVKDNNDGTADITINYAYSSYRYSRSLRRYVPKTGRDSVTYTVDANIFGQDGTARLDIKYTPSYEALNYPARKAIRAIGLADGILDGNLLMLTAEVGDDGLYYDGDFGMYEDEEYEDVEPVIYPLDYHPIYLIPMLRYQERNVNVGEPEYKFSNNDQPAPPQRNDIEYIPRDPDADSPVVVPLSTAPGQVLGAQREEATGEAPAVLGASRARGTADETTAPFVRVLVMAAVASAALFLTRKREEEN